MGRQVRKVHPWYAHVNGHLLHNMHVARMYRWSSYHSHPTFTTGRPFKTRGGTRHTTGVLLTPDILKFGIPTPIAFTPIDNNNSVDRNTLEYTRDKLSNKNSNHSQLVSAGLYKINSECQKTVINLNRCIKNVGLDSCKYYMNYLMNQCKK